MVAMLRPRTSGIIGPGSLVCPASRAVLAEFRSNRSLTFCG